MPWPFSKTRSFAGLHVCITGGSEGLGLALATCFVRESANVSLLARTLSKLQTAQKEVEAVARRSGSPSRVTVQCADVCDPSALRSAMDTLRTDIGPIDILICNAGVAHPGRFLDIDAEVYRSQMEVNYLGCVWSVKEVAPGMVERGSGSIVLISSAAGVVGIAGYSAYSPTKWALRGFADCLRMEMKAHGVGVHIAYPPDMVTPGYEREVALNPPEMEAMMAAVGDKPVQPGKVAQCIMRGLKAGQYHLPSPDPLQTLSQSTMASLSPHPFWLPIQMLIAAVSVPISMYVTWTFDRIVCKFQKKEYR